MFVVIMEYWGIDWPTKNWDRNIANYALKVLAEELINRLKTTRTLGEKRIAYRRYFTAYKRTAQATKYQGMFDKIVQDHIWSYARYLALTFGYDIEELENDWVKIIQGD